MREFIHLEAQYYGDSRCERLVEYFFEGALNIVTQALATTMKTTLAPGSIMHASVMHGNGQPPSSIHLLLQAISITQPY